LLSEYSSFYYVFIDNIVIYSNTTKEHFEYLYRIFTFFYKKNIAISPIKLYIVYPNIKLLSFYVDSLELTIIFYYVEAFYNLAFLALLKALEQYIGALSFLRYLVLYFAKLVKLLQERKTALLALGRKASRVVPSNISKRNYYYLQISFELNQAKLLSFQSI
jgi:hypothetical protein